MKHKHNEFPSDIFLIMETADVTMVIGKRIYNVLFVLKLLISEFFFTVDVDENETRVTPFEFLNVDMDKKVIKEIILPAYDANYYYTSYKVSTNTDSGEKLYFLTSVSFR